MSLSRALALTAASAALAFAAGARAQTAPGALEQLVVTAEKRPQRVQDVPVAVNAFSAGALEQLSIRSLPEVARVTPGVQLQTKKGAGQPTFVIRGVGLLDFNANNSPAAAVYADEVYQPSTVMAEMALFDLDRVEILKGPQGGLFGRDTSGGAVQVITAKPSLERREGYVTAGFGSWRRWSLEGAANFPVSDKLAIRLSALHERGDGGWQYSATDKQEWGGPDRTLGRLQVRLAPSDRFDLTLKLEAGWDGSQTPLARSVGLYALNGDFCAAALQGRRNDAGCFTLNQVMRAYTGRRLTPSAATQTSDGSTTLSHAFNRLQNRTRNATLTGVYHFDGADLTSITAVGAFHYGQNYDFSASPDRLGLQRDRSDFETRSQELRLTSTGDGPLSWLVGATYAEEDFRDDRDVDIRDNVIVQQSLGLPAAIGPYAILQLGYDQDTRYGAVYGEAAYRLSDTVRVRGALRWSDQSRRYYDGSVGVSRPLLTALSGLESKYDLDDHFSGKASVDWRPVRNVLTYASISRGYKSGGIFGGFNQVAGQVAPYKEETVWAYEAGVKATAADGRVQVDAAVFHYDYQDVQGFTNVLFPSQIPGAAPIAYPLLTNLGDARHDGVELNGSWAPAKGLTLSGGVSWLDTEYRDTSVVNISPELIRVPLDGRSRAYAPKWSGFVMASYQAALTDAIVATGEVDYNFRTDQTFPKTPVEKAIGAVEGYGLSNARLTLAMVPQALSVSVWVKNLANERYRLDVGSDGLGSYTELYGEPRSWGVEISKRW